MGIFAWPWELIQGYRIEKHFREQDKQRDHWLATPHPFGIDEILYCIAWYLGAQCERCGEPFDHPIHTEGWQ